jgi:hypothetical protein
MYKTLVARHEENHCKQPLDPCGHKECSETEKGKLTISPKVLQELDKGGRAPHPANYRGYSLAKAELLRRWTLNSNSSIADARGFTY